MASLRRPPRRTHGQAQRPIRLAALAGVAILAIGSIAAAPGEPSPVPDRDPHAAESTSMTSSILVHITHGPEHPTRAALGFAVAEAAIRQGHTVTMFLAGDGVQLVRDGVLDNLNGLGTGNLRQLYDGVVAGGARIYLSGGSSRARGVTEADIGGKPVEFASPDRLVELSLEHERMFTY